MTKNHASALKYAFLISCFVMSKNAYAAATDTTPIKNQAFNMCPAGIPLGAYSVNYEYLFKQKHGLVIRLDYEDVPDTYTSANIQSKGHAMILAYRWHFSDGMESFYIGPYIRHRVYDGSGVDNGNAFDFTVTEQTLGVNIGKRWVWQNGLNLNLAFGYGLANISRTSTPSNTAIASHIRQYEKDYGHLGPFLGEFSVGYAF